MVLALLATIAAVAVGSWSGRACWRSDTGRGPEVGVYYAILTGVLTGLLFSAALILWVSTIGA